MSTKSPKSQTAGIRKLVQQQEQLVSNALLMRQQWLTKMLDPRRDIEAECGHPEVVTVGDCSFLYRRGDIAGRIVRVWPEETWQQPPEVFETEKEQETAFEQSWKELNKRIPLVPYLLRADVLSGIGRFGILLLGLDDGQELSAPVEGLNELGENESPTERKLLYVRPFDETLVEVKTVVTDVHSPRCGLPLTYNVRFSDSSLGTDTTVSTNVEVHWTRVIHLADNRMNSEVFGQPRLEGVFNRLMDLRKVAGGSGEMFWKGGFPGLSLQSYPQLATEDVTVDTESIKAQLSAYQNGLQRYLATVGMDVKSLAVQVADPTPHVTVQMKLIAAACAVPWRVFWGSEQSQLASQEDTKAFNKRITRRREDYVNPFVLRPLVDRLIAFGVLQAPAEKNGYEIFWPDPHTPTDEEKATVAEKRTNAMSKYVASGVDALIPPFHYLTLVMGMEDDEVQASIDSAQEGDGLPQDPEADPQPDNTNPSPTATRTVVAPGR